MDLVRRTLEEARGAARSQGKDVGRGRSSPVAPGRRHQAARGGRGPARTPGIRRLLGAATSDLARSRGWSSRVAEGSVFGRWPAVVGEQIAAHAVADVAARRAC